MAKKPITISTFVVEGSGEFPFDMLRYDSCWPQNGDSAAFMSKHYTERRKITLESVGISTPSVNRWASFNWRVVTAGERDG
jgi:hypothetical protein